MDATSIADLGRSYVLNSNFRFIRFRFTHFDYLGGPPYRAPYATVSVSVCLSVCLILCAVRAVRRTYGPPTCMLSRGDALFFGLICPTHACTNYTPKTPKLWLVKNPRIMDETLKRKELMTGDETM